MTRYVKDSRLSPELAAQMRQLTASGRVRSYHGWTTLADGTRVETIKLVEKMRKFRGRLKVEQMVKLLNLRSGPMSAIHLRKLCEKYEISINEPDREYRPALVARDQAVLLAQETLEAEIAKAKAEAATAPLYRKGTLDWDAGEAEERERERALTIRTRRHRIKKQSTSNQSAAK